MLGEHLKSGELAVKLDARYAHCFCGFTSIIKDAEVMARGFAFVFYVYVGHPLACAFDFVNALVARLIVGSSFPIHRILRCGSLSQVFNSIVGWVAIDVVYLRVWPSSIGKKPCDSVGFVTTPIDADRDIAFTILASCWPWLPKKISGRRIIVEKRIYGLGFFSLCHGSLKCL